MRTYSSIEGFPVIVTSSGHNIGEVIDLVISDGVVTGLLVDQIGWLNKHLVLPLDNIYSIGHDGIMVVSEKRFTFFNKNKDTLLLKNGKRRLRGVPLFSEEGTKLGLIEDVYFMEQSGIIVGYEVTDGFVADLLEGRKVILQEAELVVGGGRAILTK